MRFATIKFFACVIAVALFTHAGCASKSEQGSGAQLPDVPESSAVPLSRPEPPLPPAGEMPSDTRSSEAPGPTGGQSQTESGENSVPAALAEENPVAGGTTPGLEKELAAPDDTEEITEACVLYLQQTLTEEQHGGVYRTGDARGSGMLLHGGPDKGEDYVLIYAIDSAAVDAALERYTGRLPEVVVVDAKYSMAQLEAVKRELEASELAPVIERFVFGAQTNTVTIMVTGQANSDAAEAFLQTYLYRDAVSVAATLPGDGSGENPLT